MMMLHLTKTIVVKYDTKLTRSIDFKATVHQKNKNPYSLKSFQTFTTLLILQNTKISYFEVFFFFLVQTMKVNRVCVVLNPTDFHCTDKNSSCFAEKGKSYRLERQNSL